MFVWLRMRCTKLCGIFRRADFSYLLLSDNNYDGCADHHDGCADYHDICAWVNDGFADNYNVHV